MCGNDSDHGTCDRWLFQTPSPKRVDRLELVRPRTMESQVLDIDSKRATVRKALPQSSATRETASTPDALKANAEQRNDAPQQEVRALALSA